MIICGTGSNCYGMNKKGEEAKANGWDYILGDEGSGYNIGIKALRTIMREYDGRGESTLLSKTIIEDLNIKDISELIKVAYSEPFSKEKIAAIAKTVCKTAKMGDRISKKILEDESNEAVISVEAVANKLNLSNQEFDLVFVGSVFKCEKYFKAILIKKLKFYKTPYFNKSEDKIITKVDLQVHSEFNKKDKKILDSRIKGYNCEQR